MKWKATMLMGISASYTFPGVDFFSGKHAAYVHIEGNSSDEKCFK